MSSPRVCTGLAMLLACISLARPTHGELGAIDCDAFQHKWTNVFREYVSVPESTYYRLYAEWNAFCANGTDTNVTSEGAVRAAWAEFSTYRPLSECSLLKESAPIELASSVSIVNETTPEACVQLETGSGLSGLRLCADVAEILAIISILCYLPGRRLVRRYVQAADEVDGSTLPNSGYNYNLRAEFRR